MCRRGGMVDTAAWKAVERELVGVRFPLAKSQPSLRGKAFIFCLKFVFYLPTLQLQIHPPWAGSG